MNQISIGGSYCMNEFNELDMMKNFNVFAITPFYTKVHSSQVLTYDYGKIASTKNTYQLLDDICIYFGSDLNGRLKSARRILRKRKNPPIIISEERGIVACQFPYKDYREPLWVIDLTFKVQPVDKNHCHIIFHNNERFLIRLSAEKVWERRRLALALLCETKYISGRRSFINF